LKRNRLKSKIPAWHIFLRPGTDAATARTHSKTGRKNGLETKYPAFIFDIYFRFTETLPVFNIGRGKPEGLLQGVYCYQGVNGFKNRLATSGEESNQNQGEEGMRKAVMGITALLLASLQNGMAETVITAQDYAVDSDVVLESAVREIKSVPRDTVNVVGDAVKFVGDEAVTAANGVAAVFKSNPVESVEKAAALETANAWNSANDIVFRSYKVSEPVGNELTTGTDSQPGSAVDVSGFFTGIEFPEHTSAMYRPEFNRLFIRQTQENMLAIEDMLAEQHHAKRTLTGKQVEIQTKFIEVSQSTLNELGFDWSFVSKHDNGANIFENLTLPGGQDIMTDGLRTAATAIGANSTAGALLVQKTTGSLQWNLIIKALEQADNTDVLSAPSITTRDGKKASIWVGEQRAVPKSFSAKSQNTSVFVEHSAWESELMGVQLEVTPELRAGGLIDLELAPKVIDLIGYDTYQVTPANASMMVWSRASAAGMALPTVTQVNTPVTAANPTNQSLLVDPIGWGFSQISQIVLAPITYGSTYWNKVYQSLLAGPSPTPEQIEDMNGGKGVGDLNGNGIPNEVDDWARYSAARVNSDLRRKMEHDEYGIPVPELNGNLPYFRLREMKTQVTVADGSTVGMGGLIYDKLETYKDKVPVLGSLPLIGRFFRSEGEKSVKRNLMIFVTATEVDVNGRRSADLAMKN
jgi:type II secretory pathway component GspD/PulD (secretin)